MFDVKRDTPHFQNLVVTFEYFQECMGQGTIKHEICSFSSTYQHEMLPVLRDSFASLLQSPTKEVYIFFLRLWILVFP